MPRKYDEEGHLKMTKSHSRVKQKRSDSADNGANSIQT
jgi:hypothetical protein